MHVLLFFLVPTYLHELNATARDKTIHGILAKRQAVSRGGKWRTSAWTGGGVEMHRTRVHLGVGGTKGEEERRRGGEGSSEAGTAHVTQGDDAEVEVQRRLEPET